MARQCIFCGDPVGSAEHVFPDWLNDVLPSLPPDTKAEWGYMANEAGSEAKSRTWKKVEIASETTNHVCHDCNTGWMSRMEGRTKPLLMPMILGEERSLTQAEQYEIGRWAVKTAMVLEKTIQHSLPFPFEQTHLMNGDLGIPPSHLRVFASSVEGEIPPLGFYYMGARSEWDEAPPMTIHFYTIQMGTLVLQVCRPDPQIPENNVWRESHITMPREASLIPPTPLHKWPPKESLTMESLLIHTHRGIPMPEGWSAGPQGIDGQEPLSPS